MTSKAVKRRTWGCLGVLESDEVPSSEDQSVAADENVDCGEVIDNERVGFFPPGIKALPAGNP